MQLGGIDQGTSVWTLLNTAVDEARLHGWSTCNISVDQALESATNRDMQVSPTRHGEGPVGTLRPVSHDIAHPHSLSARYGLGIFPLHTDGAHFSSPPTVLLLQAAAPTSQGGTLLYRLSKDSLTSRVLDALTAGVFVIGAAHAAFYVHALDSTGRVRFDPACMRPLDPLAQYVRDWFHDQAEFAHEHDWTDIDTTLVIDNTRTIHGRSRIGKHVDRELRRLMLHWDYDDAAL